MSISLEKYQFSSFQSLKSAFYNTTVMNTAIPNTELIQEQKKQRIQLQPPGKYKGGAGKQNKEEFANSTCSTTSVTCNVAHTSSQPCFLESELLQLSRLFPAAHT